MTRPANPELLTTILLNAADMVADVGADKLTLKKVAQRSGCTSAAIHYYFDSRKGLLRSTRRLLIHQADALCTAALRPAPPEAAARLHAVASAFLTWVLANPRQFAFAFLTIEDKQEEGEEVGAALKTFVGHFSAAFPDGATGDEPRTGEVLAFVSVLYGLSVLALRNYDALAGAEPQAIADLSIERFLKGCSAPPISSHRL